MSNWLEVVRALFRSVARWRPAWSELFRRADSHQTAKGRVGNVHYRVDSVEGPSLDLPTAWREAGSQLARDPAMPAEVLAAKLAGRARAVSLVVSGYRVREEYHLVQIGLPRAAQSGRLAD